MKLFRAKELAQQDAQAKVGEELAKKQLYPDKSVSESEARALENAADLYFPPKGHSNPEFAKPTTGKLRHSLLPPDVLNQLLRCMESGAAAHGAHNWKYCTDVTIYLDAAKRHLLKYDLGEYTDEDSGLSALIHAIASLVIAQGLINRGLPVEVD